MGAVFALLGVLGSMAGLGASLLSASPAAAAVGPSRAETLLVLPFENASKSARLDWLSEGLSELAVQRLAGSGQSVFPREERLAALEKLGLPTSTRFSRATMLRVAEEIDADFVLYGQYSFDGTRLSISARVLRVEPPALGPPIEESGPLEDLMNTHARVAWRVLKFLEPASAGSEQDFAGKPPRLRLDAFEHYVRGLLSLRDELRLRELREAARLEPSWDDPAFALGQLYFTRRDCEAALPWLVRVKPAHERGLEAGFDAGVCHLLLRNAASAAADFSGLLERVRGRRAAGEAPSNGADLPEALNNFGVARQREGKSREAAEEFERAARLDPEEADYWFNLGLARLSLKDDTGAAGAFREALRRQPDDNEARALLITVLERSRQFDEGKREREKYLRPDGKPALVPVYRPAALAQLDRIKMRLDTVSLHTFPEPAGQPATQPLASGASGPMPPREVLGHRAQHRQFHLARGREFLAAGKLDDAQREFGQAASLTPLDPAAHAGLAEVYRQQGRPDDAIRELRGALAARDDAALRLQLARLYLGQNRTDEARAEIEAALHLEPAPKLREEARQLLGQLDAKQAPGEKP